MQVGPVFIEGTVDAESYLRMLQNVLPELLNGLRLPQNVRENIIFMHDGAPAHWSIDVRRYLDVAYPNKWIGRGGPMRWPARSPDLNICDYFLWGHIKQIVYRNDVQNRDTTRTLIVDAFQSIPSDILQRATEDLPRRLNLCLQRHGGHFEHLP